MSSTEVLRRQHEEILKSAGEIALLLNADHLAADASPVRALLARLTGQVGVHLAIEDNAIYPKLVEHQDGEVRQTAKMFLDEMGGISAAFTSYTRKWPTPSSIQNSPAEFIEETQALFNALSTRIERENNQLYVLVDQLD
jgi:hypothetical protein